MKLDAKTARNLIAVILAAGLVLLLALEREIPGYFAELVRAVVGA